MPNCGLYCKWGTVNGIINIGLPLLALSQGYKYPLLEILLYFLAILIGIANLFSIYALIRHETSFLRIAVIIAIIDTIFGAFIAFGYWQQIQNVEIYDKPTAIMEIGPLVKFWVILASLSLLNTISLMLPFTIIFYTNTESPAEQNDSQANS